MCNAFQSHARTHTRIRTFLNITRMYKASFSPKGAFSMEIYSKVTKTAILNTFIKMPKINCL